MGDPDDRDKWEHEPEPIIVPSTTFETLEERKKREERESVEAVIREKLLRNWPK